MPDSNAYTGTATPFDFGGDFSQTRFLAKQLMNKQATTTLVQVKKVTNNGEAAPVGFVDVQPMVHQIDGKGQPVPHGTIYHLPYLRVQGGANAVIMDPQAGDIGLATFCSHDISRVKRTRAPALPGSRRRFSMSDGIYHGGMLNGVPTQMVRFASDGVHIETPNKVMVHATLGIDLTTEGKLTVTSQNVVIGESGAVAISEGLAAQGEVLAHAGQPSQVSLHTHVHPGVNVPPTPGT